MLKRRRRLPVWLPPDVQMRQYQELLIDMVNAAEDAALTGLRARTDSLHDGIELLAAIRAAIGPALSRARSLVGGIAREINKFNKKQMRKVISKVLPVDIYASEPWLVTELRAFEVEADGVLEEFSASTLARIQKIVFAEHRKGESIAVISNVLREKLAMQRRKALLVARAHVAAFNGRITHLRQESIGIKKYVWRNARDERVRGNPAGLYPDAKHNHWEKEGKVFRWDKPPRGTGHPGSDYLCRCYAEPVLDHLL